MASCRLVKQASNIPSSQSEHNPLPSWILQPFAKRCAQKLATLLTPQHICRVTSRWGIPVAPCLIPTLRRRRRPNGGANFEPHLLHITVLSSLVLCPWHLTRGATGTGCRALEEIACQNRNAISDLSPNPDQTHYAFSHPGYIGVNTVWESPRWCTEHKYVRSGPVTPLFCKSSHQESVFSRGVADAIG